MEQLLTEQASPHTGLRPYLLEMNVRHKSEHAWMDISTDHIQQKVASSVRLHHAAQVAVLLLMAKALPHMIWQQYRLVMVKHARLIHK